MDVFDELDAGFGVGVGVADTDGMGATDRRPGLAIATASDNIGRARLTFYDSPFGRALRLRAPIGENLFPESSLTAFLLAFHRRPL